MNDIIHFPLSCSFCPSHFNADFHFQFKHPPLFADVNWSYRNDPLVNFVVKQ